MDHERLERLLTSLHQTDASRSVLHRICVVSAACSAVDGAGLSRITDGAHEVIDASDERSIALEQLQAEYHEGPCREAAASNRPCLEPDLASTEAVRAWPGFSAAALDHGIGAVFAFPLLTDGVAIGALDLYSATPRRLADDEVRDALVLADLAALALISSAPTTIAGVDIAAESAEPWAYASVVHHASGMVSEQLDIDVDEALLRLRAVAFVTGQSVAAVARAIVARDLRIESWSEDA